MMSNPLSPLSPSYQNARARSPKTGSSPFLTKTLDGPPSADHIIPTSPLKKTWGQAQSPSIHTNENYLPGEQEDDDFNDFQEPASSPFRYEAREDTVDFQMLQKYQRGSPARPQFDVEDQDPEGPISSPFRPDARDETVDFQRLRESQLMSPGLSKRLGVENPESSPFRPQATDDTVDLEKLRELQAESPRYDEGSESPRYDEQPESPRYDEQPRSPRYDAQPESPRYDEQPLQPESSPFRYEQKEETVNFRKSRESQRESFGKAKSPSPPVAHSSPFRQNAKEEVDDLQRLREVQRQSFGRAKQSSPAITLSSPFKQSAKENTLDMQKLRSVPRASLGMDGRQSTAATPRKRSFDQTPQDHDDEQTNNRCKKGMVSRAEVPDIHVDYEEESSVIHNQSYGSTMSVTQERSAIGNSVMEDKQNEGMSTVLHGDDDAGLANKENFGHNNGEDLSVLGADDQDPMDGTNLSNFSVLPDMTSFAKLRAESPLKSMRGSVGPSPAARTDMYRRSMDPATPGTARRPYRASAMYDAGSPIGSPTPRRRVSRDVGNPSDTPNLLDLTDQISFYPRHSMQQSTRYSPRRSPMRNMRQSTRSPSKLSLLDFDIPPAPTPRSIPSITPRELESLKSSFMSEISSLKATLSGKEAEVASLKTAVGDAERRVGEAWEEVRNEVARKEEMEAEQAEWDRRGKEMETVLLSVRSELEDGERERDRLTRKVEEAEKIKEQLEGRIVELETQLSAARSTTSSASGTIPGPHVTSQSAEDTAREVQEAVEKVARELHTLYKSKHETKVAALKKSYESRWEKRVREAERKLATAREENDRLKVERDAAQSDNMAAANASMISRENDEHEAEKRILEAQIEGLQHEMASIKEESERLRFELKSERAEKGELVAAVDEWLAIQNQPAQAQQQQQEQREPSVSSARHPDEESSELPTENLHRSVSRSGSSGIRPPASGEKRIPRFGAGGGHSRGNSGGKSGIAMPTPSRGGIMSSIERMGRGI